jgi:hypothetical protein
LVQVDEDAHDPRDGTLVHEERHQSGGTTIIDRTYHAGADGGEDDPLSGLGQVYRLE